MFRGCQPRDWEIMDPFLLDITVPEPFRVICPLRLGGALRWWCSRGHRLEAPHVRPLRLSHAAYPTVPCLLACESSFQAEHFMTVEHIVVRDTHFPGQVHTRNNMRVVETLRNP